MSSLINQALFRVDPTEGLLQYVAAVKPFHSKVLDVLVEYVYSERMTVAATDRYHLTVGLPHGSPSGESTAYLTGYRVGYIDGRRERPVGFTTNALDVDTEYSRGYSDGYEIGRIQTKVTYSRGFGTAFSAYDEAMVGGLPQADVIRAQGPMSVSITVSGSTVTVTPDASQYVPTVGTSVSLTSTGTLPQIGGLPTLPGVVYYVVSSVGTSISLSATIGGAPVVFSSDGVGSLNLTPLNQPVNSFLLDVPAPTPYEITVASLAANQLVFADSYPITAVNQSLRQWTTPGNHTAIFPPGTRIYVNNNAEPANKSYLVSSVSYHPGTTSTRIVVSEPLSLQSTGSGRISIPKTTETFPFWPAGTAVQLESTGSLPFPLTTSTTYYIVPTTTPGVVMLSEYRYPARPSDVINLFTLGTGTLSVKRVEPFLPNELVEVTGSFQGINDGKYTITRIEPEGTFVRAFTREFVQQTTPLNVTSDGVVRFVGTYGDPVGDLITSPQLYASTYFHERIDFAFGPSPLAAYLLDSFSGSGNLVNHTSESGHAWNTFQFPNTLDQLILTGSGGLTTADTDIWARANWTPPTTPTTFYVEAELYVSESPEAGSPYFRLVAKEANLGSFLGPHVDISPNPATNKISLQFWTGIAGGGTFHTLDTSINTGNSITVRMELVNQSSVRLYANGQLLYTSGTLSWPALTFVGFNFRVPASDTQQFRLSRIQASA